MTTGYGILLYDYESINWIPDINEHFRDIYMQRAKVLTVYILANNLYKLTVIHCAGKYSVCHDNRYYSSRIKYPNTIVHHYVNALLGKPTTVNKYRIIILSTGYTIVTNERRTYIPVPNTPDNNYYDDVELNVDVKVVKCKVFWDHPLEDGSFPGVIDHDTAL